MVSDGCDHMLIGQKPGHSLTSMRGKVGYLFCVYTLKQGQWHSEVQFELITKIGKLWLHDNYHA